MADEPSGQALLTCDAVARDPNGKVTLYGIFDRIWSAKFPTVHPTLSIYWKCRLPGPGRLGVSLVKPDGTSLMELEPIESGRDSSHSMQGTFTLTPIEFPVVGEYAVVLRYNNREILRGVLKLQEKGQE